MPDADFFKRFGLFVCKDLLNPQVSAELQSEMRSAARSAATVRKTGSTYGVDASVRSTNWVRVSDETLLSIETRLLALKLELEEHFHLTLAGCSGTQFLAYKAGDFYVAHRDRTTDPEADSRSTGRQVSVVIFINSESQTPEECSYGGGALTFYGLMDVARGKSLGFPLTGQAGLLVAFLAGLVHEVTPVTHGERYTIVSWFY